jgi:hypothetical protein
VIEVETGIPIPPPRHRRRLPSPGSRKKYPWLQLEPGDSFLLDTYDIASARAMAANYGRKFAMKFCVREMVGGIRIWRIA